MAKTLSRLALLLLAAGLVIAASYALKPFRNGGENVAAIVQQAEKRPAAPHTQDALSQTIPALQQGRPDYARMNKELADDVRRNLPGAQQRLARLGPLTSLTYIGGEAQQDLYRAQFAKGSLLWGIGLDEHGIIQGLHFLSTEPPTPQSWIDNYAAFPWDERSIRMAEQFGILLATALFGRLALRLRL